MRHRAFHVLFVLTASSPVLAQETATTANTAAAPSPITTPYGTSGDTFAAPNGQYGAGLSLSKAEGMRMYGELGVYSVEFFTATLWHVSAIVGGGYKIKPDIELEAMLPLALFNLGDPADETGAAVANLHLGASYLGQKEQVRYKVGGALEWAPWAIDPDDHFAFAAGTAPWGRAAHDGGLWAPETLSIVTPIRVEYGQQAVLSADASLGVHIPTNGGDVEMSIQLDPGFGYYASPTVLVGGRLPVVYVPTSSGDNAQVAIEPFARFDLGTGFVNARFTLNLDEPLGFGFDEGKVWALHFGGGASF